ncbi:MAG TPA: type II toxin-antitoxin system VapC family toxin [Methylococcaceae bacterium]|nr:type II toxin-antitoxin system VapC family toxin [Methylococcaceae bacterium]
MRLLLDTHTLLWFLREPERLPPRVTEVVESAGQQAFVSMASLWEIAIKVSLDKLSLPGEFEELFPSSIEASGLSLLSIEAHHLAVVRRLAFHHRDPFDRLLIAQAHSENLALVSLDSHFAAYGVTVIW